MEQANPPMKYTKGEEDDNGVETCSIICVVRSTWASKAKAAMFNLKPKERGDIGKCEKSDVLVCNGLNGKLNAKTAALKEATAGIKKYSPIKQAYMTLHEHIDKNASPGVQVADTHYNGPYKQYMNKKSTEYQQEAIMRALEEKGIEGQNLMDQLDILKNEPKTILSDLPLWPSKVDIPLPSRALVILWSREARSELFETEKGRLLGKRAFYEDGLTTNEAGNYLLYSDRERARKSNDNNAVDKRKAKKQKKIATEKEEATQFQEALGRMGLGFDSEAHACV
jgi:hypothetical protein